MNFAAMLNNDMTGTTFQNVHELYNDGKWQHNVAK
jgi:hypothetical protein